MSAARRRRALSVFSEPKVANFALLLSVHRTGNRINVTFWQKKKTLFVVQFVSFGKK